MRGVQATASPNVTGPTDPLVFTMKKCGVDWKTGQGLGPTDGSSKLDPYSLRADLRRNWTGFRGEPAYSLSAYSLTAFPSHP